MENKVMEVTNQLNEYKVWADEVYEEGPFIIVEISWGDWKHDHLRCKWVLEQIGYEQLNEVTTEEDGSDTYSARHYYYKHG